MIKKTLSRNVQYFSNNNNIDNRIRRQTHKNNNSYTSRQLSRFSSHSIPRHPGRSITWPHWKWLYLVSARKVGQGKRRMLSPRQWLPGKAQMRPYPTYTITWITSRSKRPLFACTVTTASAKTKTSFCEMSILYKPITSSVVCQYLTELSDAYKVIWHHSSGDILHNTHTNNLFFKSLNTSVIQNHPISQHLLFVSYSAMVQYLAWRVMTGRQREITLNMMVAGHTKFACDRYHGITKHGWDIF